MSASLKGRHVRVAFAISTSHRSNELPHGSGFCIKRTPSSVISTPFNSSPLITLSMVAVSARTALLPAACKRMMVAGLTLDARASASAFSPTRFIAALKLFPVSVNPFALQKSWGSDPFENTVLSPHTLAQSPVVSPPPGAHPLQVHVVPGKSFPLAARAGVVEDSARPARARRAESGRRPHW